MKSYHREKKRGQDKKGRESKKNSKKKVGTLEGKKGKRGPIPR